jgi:ferredoxin
LYVILTTRPGVFKTELSEELTPVEVYDYFLFGKKRAQFVIAHIEGSPKIKIVEDEPPGVVNHVPSKFLQKFETVGAAHAELQHLARYSSSDARLEKVAAARAAGPVANGLVSVTFITNGGKMAMAAINSNLLRVSLREQGGIPFKCGGGLCGTCKCRVEVGIENTDEIKPKERKHLSAEDFRNGYRLACQTFLKGDVCVSWLPRTQPVSAVIPAATPPNSCAQ